MANNERAIPVWSVVCLLFHSSPRDIRKQKLTSQKGMMASPKEQNQVFDEILGSLKVSFLQPHDRFLSRASRRRRMLLVKLEFLKFGQEKTRMLFYHAGGVRVRHNPTHKGSWIKLLICLISIVRRSSTHLVREMDQNPGSKHCFLFWKTSGRRAIWKIFKIS